jgi:hypothetical protein
MNTNVGPRLQKPYTSQLGMVLPTVKIPMLGSRDELKSPIVLWGGILASHELRCEILRDHSLPLFFRLPGTKVATKILGICRRSSQSLYTSLWLCYRFFKDSSIKGKKKYTGGPRIVRAFNIRRNM